MNLEQLIDHFNLATDSIESLEKLRELILNLAIRGKLTKHNQNDEPVVKLLEEIRIEKENLYQEGKIRKPKYFKANLSSLNFSLPDNWEPIPFGNITTIWNGRQYKRSELLDDGIPIIRIQNLINNSKKNRGLKQIEWAI